MTQTEVSMLSAPKPIRFADEDDLLAQVVEGEDGLILEAPGRRGTFLPQVWESIPGKREFIRAPQAEGGPSGGLPHRALPGAALPCDQVEAVGPADAMRTRP